MLPIFIGVVFMKLLLSVILFTFRSESRHFIWNIHFSITYYFCWVRVYNRPSPNMSSLIVWISCTYFSTPVQPFQLIRDRLFVVTVSLAENMFNYRIIFCHNDLEFKSIYGIIKLSFDLKTAVFSFTHVCSNIIFLITIKIKGHFCTAVMKEFHGQ